ncbi:MAG: methyltransferase domain-containing protein [Alphaproteobacteria bacterium]|nr:methyltransferase domain-containing protein [Alphaproteobacteria bacterium]
MAIAVAELVDFYKTPLGRISRRLVQQALSNIDVMDGRRRVVGLGFATPYLRPYLGKSERVIAFMPARQGVISWPPGEQNHTVLTDLLELPLTDAAIDLVLAFHALEHVADAEELMREIWRITAPGAHLIIAVPRRRGLWAQRDNNPFGQGNPFSRSQLGRLLRQHSFVPVAWCDVLHVPPSQFLPLVRSAGAIERVGGLLGSPLAGIMLVRAVRQNYPAVIRRARSGRLIRLPDLAPQPALPVGGS